MQKPGDQKHFRLADKCCEEEVVREDWEGLVGDAKEALTSSVFFANVACYHGNSPSRPAGFTRPQLKVRRTGAEDGCVPHTGAARVLPRPRRSP